MKGSVKLPVFIDDARKYANTTQLRAKYLGASYEAEYCQWQTLHGLGSLMETASLIITPNAYLEGKLIASYPPDPIGDLSVTRATTATRVNSAGLVESVANNIPRLDYSNGTCPSILVEPQRTNLVTYSSSFDNAVWTPAGYGTGTATRTANYGIAPDGTMTADRIQLSQGNLAAEFYQRIQVGAGTYTLSFWAKSLSGTPTLYTAYNMGYENEITFTTEWVRYEYTMTTTDFAGLDLITWNNLPTTSLTADLLVWGAQLEAGSFATSYIPTTSASVTRNADVISKTGISSLIGQTEGTLFAEIDWVNNGNDVVFATLSDGTTNNRIHFGYAHSSNFWYLYVESGGASQVNITYSAPTNGKYRLAVGYKLNDYAFYVNGVQIGTDTSATVPSTSQLNVGGFITTGLECSNRAAALWKTRLTNTQLAQLTTI